MAIVRLVAEGVGPFPRLELDLSDGKGHPHPGPHILAGVNGSGKSTALRAIAWLLDRGRGGFDYDQWRHLASGWPSTRAMAHFQAPNESWIALGGVTSGVVPDNEKAAFERSILAIGPQLHDGQNRPRGYTTALGPNFAYVWGAETAGVKCMSSASYTPSRTLQHLARPFAIPTGSPFDPFRGSLAFENTVKNETLQTWLVGLLSKRAIALERRESPDRFIRTLERFQEALGVICGYPVKLEADISQPSVQPVVRIGEKRLNFSQLSDGVRHTLGWLGDFMMRQDAWDWDTTLGSRMPGILLLDEVDAHLHPRWQRTLLPAMRKALPDVQIIVSTHSPFVINSCPGSRVHVLDLDERGNAFVRESIDAPIGSSITSTIKDIFDVDSRFDYYTEQQLKEWNDLKRKDEVENLSQRERTRLDELTELLALKSEELRLIVTTPPKLSRTLMEALSKR